MSLFAHGIIHRDLKPDNILVSSPSIEDLAYLVVQLSDFGSAIFHN